MTTIKVLLVDDEPLARARLRSLLAQIDDTATLVVGEAGDAHEALALLAHTAADLALLDLHLPGRDGLTLAHALAAMPSAPAVVFVTAHEQHALAAFETSAVDYLTKPVRLERLRQALQKTKRMAPAAPARTTDSAEPALLLRERDRIERVPLGEVLYFRSGLKYLTVRTAARSHLMEGSLAQIEQRHAADFFRVHRGVLVARRALRALERSFDAHGAESWVLRLDGIDETLPVSRRLLPAVRDAVTGAAGTQGRR